MTSCFPVCYLFVYRSHAFPEQMQLYRLLDIAVFVSYQEKYHEAELLYKEAKEIWEATLGPRHPLMSNAFNNWAGLMLHQARTVTYRTIPCPQVPFHALEVTYSKRLAVSKSGFLP